MLTLAFPNHKRRSMVRAKKRKNSARRKTSMSRRPHSMKMNKRRNGHRRRKNPSFFGASVTPVKMAEYVGAGLVGVTINRAIVAALPATITSNNIFATGAALAIAVAQWWIGSMMSKDLGSAFGFGGLMNAVSTGLNTFIPSVGSYVSLSGRGFGDFVPATFTIPPQPAGIGGLSSYNN
jgi:NAD(P)H-hydrate repair Nnr-like enzyme with NAD(P)H-hydrate dehydratase domain